jgi:uncharacterized protein (DUF58 family)
MIEEVRSPAMYLKPEVIRQIGRLDLKAKYIVEGFISGLHGSPYDGFSVEFSEHRKYEPGDEISAIDWAVYGRTDRYYVKKFRAETNMQCFLVVDASASMNYATAGITKFDYAVGVAAALAYLMIKQNDPVGLITFSDRVRSLIPPRSRRSHLYAILEHLAKLKTTGQTSIGGSMHEVAELVRRRSMVIVFSDFLEGLDTLLPALHHLAFKRHDIVLFHVLDHAEVTLPFDDLATFTDLETGERLIADPESVRTGYLNALNRHLEDLRSRAGDARIDYVLMDTATPYDKALSAFLINRRARA